MAPLWPRRHRAEAGKAWRGHGEMLLAGKNFQNSGSRGVDGANRRFVNLRIVVDGYAHFDDFGFEMRGCFGLEAA